MAPVARSKKEEVVLRETRLHWAAYLAPGLWSLVLVGYPFLLAAAVRDATSRFTLTDRRLVIRSGLLFRRQVDCKLARVAGVSVEQGFLGRLLGYGTLVVATGDTRMVFRGVARADEFRRAVNETRMATISPAHQPA